MDQQPQDALTSKFTRYGFLPDEALVRARVLYFTQVDQYTLDIKEDMSLRLSRTRNFVRAFSGQSPTDAEIEDFKAAAFG